MAKTKERLLFVDTNKFLDFYRAEEAGISLLGHLDQLHSHTITTFQVEMEFKKHRVNEIAKSVQTLKLENSPLSFPAFLQEAKSVEMIKKNLKDCKNRLKLLKNRVKGVLANPSLNDRVYKTVQRLFAAETEFNLVTDHIRASAVKRKAWRRFITGAPPRKVSDTSLGDAINWEWILECVQSTNRDVVVVSRDSDYSTKLDDCVYPNDWLATEIRRINKQRKLLVFHRLSDALKELNISVSAEEEKDEDKLTKALAAVSVSVPVSGISGTGFTGQAAVESFVPGAFPASFNGYEAYRRILESQSSTDID